MTRDEIAARLGWTRNDMVDVVEKIVQAAVDAEREACAKLCEDIPLPKSVAELTHLPTIERCVNAIRARGV